tara:strand:- start:5053 stop:6333 length:1281 start_codon:yes stop_codon:yes gene_type:complete
VRLRDVYLMILIGLFFRVCVSLWNAFWGPSIGANADATSFHQAAVNLFSYQGPIHELGEISVKSGYILVEHPDFSHGWHLLDHFYSQSLAFIYFISTDSLFIGSLFSVFAWTTSASLLIQIMQLLQVKIPDQFKAMAIYSLLPSSIILTGVTLREPFELLLVNVAMFTALKVYLNKSIKFAVFLVLLIFFMKKFHIALYTFGLLMAISLIILLTLRKLESYYFFQKFLIAIFIIFIIYFIIDWYGLSNIIPFNYFNEKELYKAASKKLSVLSLYETRTQFIYNIEINGIFDFFLFMPKHLLQYLFEPMPWRVEAPLDFMVLIENLFRAVLIFKILAGLFFNSLENRKILAFIFFSYLAIEAVWSSGTVNWGTAIRHHIPGMGLLIAAAFSCSKEKQNSPFYSILRKNISPRVNSPIPNDIDTGLSK